MTVVQSTYSFDMTAGFAGQLLKSEPGDVWAMTNKEASYSIPVGVAVAFEGSTDDRGALSPDAITDVIAGITAHSHGHRALGTFGNIDDDGDMDPGVQMDVARRGRMRVVCENGCSPGQRLHVRAVAAGAEVEGALRSAADGTDTIDCTNQGQWLSTAAAGGLAILEFDFTNSPTIVDPA